MDIDLRRLLDDRLNLGRIHAWKQLKLPTVQLVPNHFHNLLLDLRAGQSHGPRDNLAVTANLVDSIQRTLGCALFCWAGEAGLGHRRRLTIDARRWRRGIGRWIEVRRDLSSSGPRPNPQDAIQDRIDNHCFHWLLRNVRTDRDNVEGIAALVGFIHNVLKAIVSNDRQTIDGCYASALAIGKPQATPNRLFDKCA